MTKKRGENKRYSDKPREEQELENREKFKALIKETSEKVDKPLIEIKEMPNHLKHEALFILQALVNKSNQSFYDFFKSNGLDFSPVRLKLEKSHGVRIMMHVRTDWVKHRAGLNGMFYEWMKKQGVKRKYLRVMQTRTGEFNEDVDLFGGKGQYGIKQHGEEPIYYQKMPQFLTKFKKQFFESDVFKNYVKTTAMIFQAKAEIDKNARYFYNPITPDILKRLIDPEISELFEIDNSPKFYSFLQSKGIDPKLFKTAMGKILTKTAKDASLFLDAHHMILDESKRKKSQIDKYNKLGFKFSGYQSRFPNIARIEQWYIRKGMQGAQPDKHYYTYERYNALKTTTQKLNFINRAVFMIANSIFMHSQVRYIQDSKTAYDKARFTKAGKKKVYFGKATSITKARRYRSKKAKITVQVALKRQRWRSDLRSDARYRVRNYSVIRGRRNKQT